MTPPGVVTVADLLSRNAPVPVKIEVDDDATQNISVGSLLRREGRAPHAAGHPVQPRGRQDGQPAGQSTPEKRVLVRRGAIAAGTLLAAGSVFGAAVLTEVTPTGVDVPDGAQDDGTGAYPGQGLLDGGQDGPVAPPPVAVIDQAAVSHSLDAGTAPPDSWIPVAFPSALAGVPTGTDAAAATPETTDSDDSGSGGGVGDGPGGSSGDSSSSNSEDDSTPPPVASDDNDDDNNSNAGDDSSDDGGLVNDLTDTVGNTLQGLGGGSDDDSDDADSDHSRHSSSDNDDSDDDGDDHDDRGVVGDLTHGLGKTVKDTGSALDKVTSPLTNALTGDSDDDDSHHSSSSDSDDDDSDDSSRSSRSSAPQHDEDDSESDDGGSSDDGGDKGDDGGDDGDDGGDSDGVLSSVGDLAGGLL